MDNVKKWRIPILIAFLILGLMLSTQFRTQQIYLSDLTQQKTDDLVLMLKNLHDKRDTLQKELGTLQSQQRALDVSVNTGTALTDTLRQEEVRDQIVLGLVPVQGDGVTVNIKADSPVVYLDVVDIVNELWNSQAEAISINDQRITPWSAIYWNNDNLAITVNGHDLALPYAIKAIGNPDSLYSGLLLPGGLLDTLATFKVYPVVNRAANLQLPGIKMPETKYMTSKP